MKAPRPRFLAALAVLLAGSAVYFAGSIVAPSLIARWGAAEAQAGWITIAVQAGFVSGTLLSVVLDLPDRFRPGRLIAVLLVAAAVANALTLAARGLLDGLALRFLAGAFAGPVYPILMRLLATWYPRLGPRLGILLGAYTFGLGITAILRFVGLDLGPALLGSSFIAILGAILALLTLTAGPLLPARQRFDLLAAARSFRVPAYRRSSMAYYGHMWELFALWGLLPFWLLAAGWQGMRLDLLVAGAFIAGAVGCVLGGLASARVGEARVGRAALALSGILCLASPLLFVAPPVVLAIAVLVWGAAAVADSAMFSALSAQAAPREYVGAALTTQNAIGFAVPMVPLAFVPLAAATLGWQYAFVALALGPIVGVPLVHLLVREPPRVPDPPRTAPSHEK